LEEIVAKIERFEDIEAWQKARELTRQIYDASNDGPFARDFGLRDQIRRASVSIMSNIAEGFERGTNKEFIQFLYIAKGSSGEVRSQLYVAFDLGYIDKNTFETIRSELLSISRQISGFIQYLQSSPMQGGKL
jgi:four helix bundle protein